MPTPSSRSRYLPLRLRPGYRLLPPESTAPEVGEALVRSLYATSDHHRWFALERHTNGDFARSSWPRGTFADRPIRSGYKQTGSLTAALLAAPADNPSWSARLYLGIPAFGAETATAGALLIRLFAAAEQADVAVSFEHIPWASRHLRYRLCYAVALPGGQPEGYRFLHGPDALTLLLKAVTFLSSIASR